MATSVLATVTGMAALSAVFVATLRFGMEAPVTVCALVALPAVAISTTLALYLQWVLGVGLVDLLTGTGVAIVLFGGVASLVD